MRGGDPLQPHPPGVHSAPNADTYWVGEAGPGPSYLEAGGAVLHVPGAGKVAIFAQVVDGGTVYDGHLDHRAGC